MLPLSDKESSYKRIVDQRKTYDFTKLGLKNPAELKLDYDEHLNAWGYWHSHLKPDILLIGQDFGDEDYYNKYQGKDNPSNLTNLNIEKLFTAIGIDTGKSDAPSKKDKLHFTNAVLGVKGNGMASSIKSKKCKNLFMSIRNKALKWYKAKYGHLDAPIYTSKYYQPEESWPKKNVWWPKIPIKVIENSDLQYLNILCQIALNINDFHHLRVPTKFLIEHLKGFHTIGEQISLYLSADPETLFKEERGEAGLNFSIFIVNNVVS